MASGGNSDLGHFRSIAWCAKLLKDPNFKHAATPSRQSKASTEDAFFAETLKTSETISAFLSMYRRPAEPGARIEEVRVLVQLGYGLNGYPHIAHGGAQCCILDEAMALLLTFNKDLEGGPIRVPTVTASLKVSFLKPVKTPAVVLATSNIAAVHGRKHLIRSQIQDENGAVLAKAEALFIALNGRQKDVKL